MKTTKHYTDYEMQLILEDLGHILYDPIVDNQVDNETLYELAIKYGYEWSEENEGWFKQ